MFRFKSLPVLAAAAVIAAATGLAIPQARAGVYDLCGCTDAASFALLYEGNGGKSLSINNGPGPDGLAVVGNVGIGGTGSLSISGPLTVQGNVEFASSPPNPATSPFTGGLVLTGTYTGGNGNVTSDLTAFNTLSQNLSTASGSFTANGVTLTSAGTTSINGTGTIATSGSEYFTLSSVSLGNGQTLTIQGDNSGTQTVVFNVPISGGVAFNGTIDLTGGLTPADVLFNVDVGDYSTLSGGSTLTISTNGTTEAGTFLDPNANFQINHGVVDGSVIGGDSQNSSLVSGGQVIVPAPEIGHGLPGLVAVGGVLFGFGLWERSRKRRSLGTVIPHAAA
jgi:hypothetical protein